MWPQQRNCDMIQIARDLRLLQLRVALKGVFKVFNDVRQHSRRSFLKTILFRPDHLEEFLGIPP